MLIQAWVVLEIKHMGQEGMQRFMGIYKNVSTNPLCGIVYVQCGKKEVLGIDYWINRHIFKPLAVSIKIRFGKLCGIQVALSIVRLYACVCLMPTLICFSA